MSDCNYGSTVVVEKTGMFGLGRPVFISVAPEGQTSAELEENQKILTLTQPTIMWYPYIDHTGDAYVHGRWVGIAKISPKKQEVGVE